MCTYMGILKKHYTKCPVLLRLQIVWLCTVDSHNLMISYECIWLFGCMCNICMPHVQQCSLPVSSWAHLWPVGL